MIGTIVAAAGIPSALVGLLVWCFQRKIDKRERKKAEETARYRAARERKEADREQLEVCLVESVNAAMALSEATAKAVQRIPDAHCNGDMHAALDYAAQVKHNQKDFLLRKGIGAIV